MSCERISESRDKVSRSGTKKRWQDPCLVYRHQLTLYAKPARLLIKVVYSNVVRGRVVLKLSVNQSANYG